MIVGFMVVSCHPQLAFSVDCNLDVLVDLARSLAHISQNNSFPVFGYISILLLSEYVVRVLSSTESKIFNTSMVNI
jgi:hypothetical protein